jgi:ketosteroid isomerase-like protein
MSEENKAIIKRWFAAVNRADEAGILDCLTDDFEFISMVVKPEYMHYTWDRNRFAAAPASMSSQMKSPITMQIISIISEGDKAAVEANTDSHLKNGKHYNNAYHFAFELRDGKIAKAREYSCSYLAHYCFADNLDEAGFEKAAS